MAFEESGLMSQVQDLQVRYEALRQAYEPALAKMREFKTNFGVRERQDGSIDIDFDKFAAALGIDGALELRRVIDETYNISGKPGDKPRITLKATA